MYAIVITGGKQYRVSENDVIEVEKLKAELGATVELNVAFIADGTDVIADQATLAAAKVFATVEEHYKGVKALVFKFQKRKGYKRTRGHRQELTRIRISEISLSGKQSKQAAVKADAKPAKADDKAAAIKETASAKKSSTVAKGDSTAKASTAKKTAKSETDSAKSPAKTTKTKAKAEKEAVVESVVEETSKEQAVEPEKTAE